MPRKNKKLQPEDIAAQKRQQGLALVQQHPIFGPMAFHASIHPGPLCPQDGWAVVAANGEICVHPTRIGQPEEWCYIYAHCLLHLGFGHFKTQKYQHKEWNAACDCSIARFLADLKLGQPPSELRGLVQELDQISALSSRSEERLFEIFCEQGLPPQLFPTGTAGRNATDMHYVPVPEPRWGTRFDWQDAFALGLEMAVASAVDIAGGIIPAPGKPQDRVMSEAQRARSWFISSYPLLGSLAATFEIIQDQQICHRLQISVAAVDMQQREIYINPAAGLTQDELRFVMAHELLHVGLRHDVRCGGRDFYLWNVACDYVVNAWLVEMGVGQIPQIGGLYDPDLKGESAESVYDRIVTDLRRYRKSATFRGIALGDMISSPGWWTSGAGCDLDEFYRSCLTQGLLLHQDQGRGYISAGLIEEIRALSQPPIPWDVELAQWFDHYFQPLEQVRTYARLSRRQSSTPNIPRPLWVPQLPEDNRTFGVLLDTSGSMSRNLLAKALGAIASYSLARDVSAVRVVFCDVASFDQGYMKPEEIASSVKVRGRGGTILQPGIDLLETARDFPKDGPILIITDGRCDHLHIHHDHAFLIPEGRSLPFRPHGPIFRIQ